MSECVCMYACAWVCGCVGGCVARADTMVHIDSIALHPPFAGEGEDHSLLGPETFDEPLNMHSKPIIMFLSMDQKISAQVTGYTAITET